MNDALSAADALALLLTRAGARLVFGVASIHNLPLLDALDRSGAIRFVPARGEAGAVNMADGFARATGSLGIAVTSTGGGAGNACGALIEALTAGIPLLHITGQIASPYLERERAFIHETKDQLGMLRAVSKRAYRIYSADTVIGTIREAIGEALTPPCGPVSVEIPIDVQGAMLGRAALDDIVPLPARSAPSGDDAVAAIARALRSARRPLLWLGGGARAATVPVRRLADLGVAVVTTQHGRGILDESHPMALGNSVADPAVERFYARCDTLLIAGSRLRGNETLNWKLDLPVTRFQIDLDPRASGRSYTMKRFAVADATAALTLIADDVATAMNVEDGYRDEVTALRAETRAAMNAGLGDYAGLIATLAAWMPPNAVWVRDVTLANSMWANRFPHLQSPEQNINAVGTGIGQGLPMAIGAALGVEPHRKTVLVTGDGGLMLCAGELATAMQERADLLIIVMNDGGYGVIRNIQDARFAGRCVGADFAAVSFRDLAAVFGIPAVRITREADVAVALSDLGNAKGPALIEIDMDAFGSYAGVFTGSPDRAASAAAPAR